jgi:hypothetical protein
VIRFAFFNHQYFAIKDKFGSAIEFNFRSKNGNEYRENIAVFTEYWIEFLVMAVAIYTFVTLKNLKREAAIQAQENLDKENLEGRKTRTTKIDVNILNSHLEQPDSLKMTDAQKLKRSLSMLVWYFFSMTVMSMIIAKSLSQRPNLPKTVSLALHLFYMINLFRHLSIELQGVRIIRIIDTLCQYFYSAFVTDIKTDKRYDFKYTDEIERNEILQNRLYFITIIKKVEEIFRIKNRRISFLQIVFCFLLNLFTLLTHTWYKYLTLTGEQDRPEFASFRRFLSFDPSNKSVVEEDLIFVQVMVFWLLIDLAVYIEHFQDAEKLIEPISDALVDANIRCLETRLDLYTYQPPRFGASLMAQKSKDYMAAYDLFCAELKKENRLADDPEDQEKLSAGDVQSEQSNSSEHSQEDSSESKEEADDQGSNNEANEESVNKSVNKSENSETYEQSLKYVEYYMSEQTGLQEKILFVYFNKNKYFIGTLIRSALFNIPRLAVCVMLINLLFSQSAMDYFLLLLSFVYSFRTTKFFLDSSFAHLILFALYFILNWMLLRFDLKGWEFYESLQKLMATKPTEGSASTRRVILLLPFAIYNVGFITLLFWVHYALNELFVLKKNIKNNFHIITMDKYIVIDYSKWKKGAISAVNFIFKLAHSLILEGYAIGVAIICFFITGHVMFKSPVFLLIFLLIISENIESLKTFAKSVLVGKSTNSRSRQFLDLAGTLMEVVCWMTIIVQSYNLEKVDREDSDLSIGVILIYYMSLTLRDLLNSREYQENRKKIKKEERLKTTFSALNYTYHLNEQKLFKRISYFFGKEKLEKMAKDCVLNKNFEQVALYEDYNSADLVNNLNEIHSTLLTQFFSGFESLKHKMVNSCYEFLDSNINHFRYQDLFVLYRNIVRRNRMILKSDPLDLRLYFQNEYRAFENTLKDIAIFYDLMKERDPFKLEIYRNKYSTFRDKIMKEKGGKGQSRTYTEMGTYEWALKANDEKKDVEEVNKPEELLLECSKIFLKEITRPTGGKGGMVYFENLKVELNKKGYVNCVFAGLNVVLYNMRDDHLLASNGFVEFKFKVIYSLLSKFIMTNIELTLALFVSILSAWNGGIFNFVIIGIILFCIMIEETFGNLGWWRTIYMFSLLKLFLSFSVLSPKWTAFLVGDHVIIELILMYCYNIVIFQQRKSGFSENFRMSIEDPGTAVVRVTAF